AGPGCGAARSRAGRRPADGRALAGPEGTHRSRSSRASVGTLRRPGALILGVSLPGSADLWCAAPVGSKLLGMIESTPIQTGFGAESTIWDVVEGIDLTGARAVVTGASSGIGIET